MPVRLNLTLFSHKRGWVKRWWRAGGLKVDEQIPSPRRLATKKWLGPRLNFKPANKVGTEPGGQVKEADGHEQGASEDAVFKS